MAGRPQSIQHNQAAVNYVNKKGINELFEAMMTGLMVHKPDDHIAFIRECLDKVPSNPHRIRWDYFVTKSNDSKAATSPARSSVARNRPKPLPPVRNSTTSTPRNNPTSDRRTTSKPIALPPIENSRKKSLNPPIVFILSTSNSTRICSKLLERHPHITYLSINDIANIDDEQRIGKYEHRYDAIQRSIEQHRSNAQAFLIAGHLDEKNFSKKWQEKLQHIELIILFTSEKQSLANQNLNMIQIDSNDDFDTILANFIRATDEIFKRSMSLDEQFQVSPSKSTQLNLPIIFCINNYRPSSRQDNDIRLRSLSIDEEFDSTSEDQQGEINNSFIYMLCERLSEQFSFQHIHYEDFEQLKMKMIESMSTSAGYIIDHFPTTLDDLQKFQIEIGPCAVLIYIGEHQSETNDDELNTIVNKFKKLNKAIYIDSRMEVDEIYEDLKNDILKHI